MVFISDVGFILHEIKMVLLQNCPLSLNTCSEASQQKGKWWNQTETVNQRQPLLSEPVCPLQVTWWCVEAPPESRKVGNLWQLFTSGKLLSSERQKRSGRSSERSRWLSLGESAVSFTLWCFPHRNHRRKTLSCHLHPEQEDESRNVRGTVSSVSHQINQILIFWF